MATRLFVKLLFLSLFLYCLYSVGRQRRQLHPDPTPRLTEKTAAERSVAHSESTRTHCIATTSACVTGVIAASAAPMATVTTVSSVNE